MGAGRPITDHDGKRAPSLHTEDSAMTVRHLQTLLCPKSVAVVGASRQEGSIGHTVLANILAGGFQGPVFAVNPHRAQVEGATWVSSVSALPSPPDLAVITCPAPHVPGVVRELGALGTRDAVILANGFAQADSRTLLAAAAREHGVRIIGPNSLGVQVPAAGLNASFAPRAAGLGRMALLSQSGAVITAMLDWAASRHVGFSGVVSAGDMLDVDLGDLLDLYAADPHTDAILMYVEGVTDAAKFMSAARAATRIKPVVAIKAGRSTAAGHAALSHTGAMTGSYDVYEAAFRRAGIILVESITELFDAAEMLCRYRPVCGQRVAVVTNGGGAGVLAVDALQAGGHPLAPLADHTLTSLDEVLPAGWSRGNPIDVVGDAHADRFEAAVAAAGNDPNTDAVLVIHCPTAVESGAAMAEGALRGAANVTKPVVGCWLGPDNASAARPRFEAAHLALFESIEDAVRGLGFLRQASEGRAAVLRAPAKMTIPDHDRSRAQAIIGGAHLDGRTLLSAVEARAILSAYGVPTVPTRFARDADAVVAACSELAPPYVVKIASPDLSHKSDVGGVATGLPDAAAAKQAAQIMGHRIAREHPSACIVGFEVEPMITEPNGVELIVGVADDATFGPVLAVGAGGKAVEVLRDRALELPPLDDELARRMIARTRVAVLLAGYRDVPPANVEAVVQVLEAVSTMIADFPDIVELDINPLLVGPDRVTALDVRIRVSDATCRSRQVIRPMPIDWAADLTTRAGVALQVRPVRPDDEAALADLFRHVTPEDLRFRFLTGLREVGRDRLVAMTQIDYARTMNFLAFAGNVLVATAMLACDPDRTKAELAISVRSDFKGKGVSWTLMQHVLRYAEAEGIGTVESVESAENHAALALEREMGFRAVEQSGTERVVRRTVTA